MNYSLSNESAERPGITDKSNHNQRIVSLLIHLASWRFLLSLSDSEKKIDHISDRLANIEAALKRTNGKTTSAQSKPDVFHSQGGCGAPNSSGLLKEQLVPDDAYGATAETHSILASRTVDKAIEGTKAFGPALGSALVALKDTLGNAPKHPTRADLSFGARTSFVDNEPQPSPIELRDILSRADGE